MVPLPIALYSLLLHIFVPESAAAQTDDNLPFFIYDAHPTFCFGLLAAFDLGLYQYIIPSPLPDDLPKTFAKYLQDLLLKHVPEENLNTIFDSFEKVDRQLPKLPKTTGTTKKGNKSK